MKQWMYGIRGAMLVVALWVIGWGLGFGGIMELVDPDGKVQDIWPFVLAVPGLIGGVLFAAMLLFGEGGRSLDEVSLGRFALWGAATGVIIGLLTIPAEVGDASPGAAGMIGIATVLGTVAGLGTGLFFRLVARWQTRRVAA